MAARSPYTEVLSVFADYGFRKTSMEELARAAGVARQTLYNRFESKEGVLKWAVDGLVEELRRRAIERLHGDDASAAEALLEAFCEWLGPIVPLLHDSRHGEEILNLGSDARRRASADPLEAIASEIRDFLLARGVCEDRAEAEDVTFLLAMAGKGLLLATRSEEEFRAGMARILAGAGIESD